MPRRPLTYFALFVTARLAKPNDNIDGEINPNDQCGIHDNNNLLNATLQCAANNQSNATTTPSTWMQNAVSLNNASQSFHFHAFSQSLLTEYDELSVHYNDSLLPAPQQTESAALNTSNHTSSSKKESSKNKAKTNAFNFASFDGGAMILSKSDGIKSAKSILIDRRDKYMMIPSDLEDKYFVVQLSEDIVVDRIELSNFEHYSSNIKHIRIYARTDHDEHREHTENTPQNSTDSNQTTEDQPWSLISDIVLEDANKNTIRFTHKHWVRLLKIEILSYFGNEYYCTITQIKVFGSTMLPHWQKEVLSHLDEADQLKQNITNNLNHTILIAAHHHHHSDNRTVQVVTSPHTVADSANTTSQHSESKQHDKQLSVFTILTKRITSLELNLTRQSIQMSNLFVRMDELDHKFAELHVNLSNHMLFQSYGISMLLKSFKDKIDDGIDVHDHRKTHEYSGNEQDEEGESKFARTSGQTSNLDDLFLWKRQEQLERIEQYLENLALMIRNLCWIGLAVIVVQLVLIVCFILYALKCCRCCRFGKAYTKQNNKQQRVATPSSNALSSTASSSRHKSFAFSSFNLKKHSRRKVRK